jgi:hypothetical protein
MMGVTTALYSATRTSDTNTFTAGTVEVALGSSSVTCNVPQIMPGDSSAGHPSGSRDMSTCVYDVRYTGTAPAWLAVDVLVDGGSPALYTGGADGFQVLLRTSGGLNLVDGTTWKAGNGTPTALVNGTTVTRLLLSGTPATSGDTVTFNLDYLLPMSAPNALQGGASSVTLTFRAVQSDNQPIGSCVAGRQCTGISWS